MSAEMKIWKTSEAIFGKLIKGTNYENNSDPDFLK